MEMADQSPTEKLRAEWLFLARKWLDILPREPQRAAANAAAHHGAPMRIR